MLLDLSNYFNSFLVNSFNLKPLWIAYFSLFKSHRLCGTTAFSAILSCIGWVPLHLLARSSTHPQDMPRRLNLGLCADGSGR